MTLENPNAHISQAKSLLKQDKDTTSAESAIRVTSLPSEKDGRLARDKARKSDLKPPTVFGDKFWGLNPGKSKKKYRKF